MTRERLAGLYIVGITLLGGITLVAGSATIDPDRFDALVFLLLALLAGVSQRLPVFLFRNSAVSVAFAATIATYVLFGTGPALWVNLVSATVNAFTPKRKTLEKALFNAGVLVVAAFFAGSAYGLLAGDAPQRDMLRTVLAVAASGLVYFLANSWLVALVIALTTGATVREIYRENYAWMTVNWLATSVNGAALALAYQSLQLFGFFTFVMPLGVAWYSFKLYMTKSNEVRRRNDELQGLNATLDQTNVKLRETHLSVVGALIGALEAKDRFTHGHSAATMFHAVALARKLDLSEDETAAIQLAALFHDIGNIGVADHILRKPTPLGWNEWNEVKGHSAIGANVLANIPTLANVRPIVLAHHERWDGRGYPNGLAGEDIPLGARVIAIADAFQAMTSTRPYRPAMTREQAVAEVHRGAGTQFDPRLVQLFVGVLEEEAAHARARPRARLPDLAVEAAGATHAAEGAAN